MSVVDLVDLYCQAWSEPGHFQRRQMLADCCIADVLYVDPERANRGVDWLCDTIGKAQLALPGGDVVRITDVHEHHGFVRYAWAARSTSGRISSQGVNFFDLTPDGQRVVRIVGFAGQPVSKGEIQRRV